MENAELKTLTKRGLALLRLDAETWKALENTRLSGTRFSLTFQHGTARVGRAESLVLIAVDGEKPGLQIGLIRSVQAISTFDSRVVFDFIRPVKPNTLNALLTQVTETTLHAGATKLANDHRIFRAISTKLGERLVNLIAAIPSNTPALQRILSWLRRPKHFNNARAMQQDAIGLALKAFGVADDPATTVALSGDTTLGTLRIQEDAVIEHDARWIPGWQMEESYPTGYAVFTQEHEQLEVFTANKRPLEELFGVDLIYLNRTRGALVMVQYKMMESEGRRRYRIQVGAQEYTSVEDSEWTVPINDQFKDELARMTRFDKDLAPRGPYRLNSSPFFFKLVRRNASAKAPGIVLSLGHLKQMIAEGVVSGPKGGLRINYRSLDGHYLRSDPLVDLVRSGYIGTRSTTTKHLQELISAALSGGRAVVAAIQSAISSGDWE